MKAAQHRRNGIVCALADNLPSKHINLKLHALDAAHTWRAIYTKRADASRKHIYILTFAYKLYNLARRGSAHNALTIYIYISSRYYKWSVYVRVCVNLCTLLLE